MYAVWEWPFINNAEKGKWPEEKREAVQLQSKPPGHGVRLSTIVMSLTESLSVHNQPDALLAESQCYASVSH